MPSAQRPAPRRHSVVTGVCVARRPLARAFYTQSCGVSAHRNPSQSPGCDNATPAWAAGQQAASSALASGFTHGAQDRETLSVCASRWTGESGTWQATPLTQPRPGRGHTHTSVWNEQLAGQGQGRDRMLTHQGRQAPCKTQQQTSVRTVSLAGVHCRQLRRVSPEVAAGMLSLGLPLAHRFHEATAQRDSAGSGQGAEMAPRHTSSHCIRKISLRAQRQAARPCCLSGALWSCGKGTLWCADASPPGSSGSVPTAGQGGMAPSGGGGWDAAGESCAREGRLRRPRPSHRPSPSQAQLPVCRLFRGEAFKNNFMYTSF